MEFVRVGDPRVNLCITEPDECLLHEDIWGPIPYAKARAVGAFAGCTSRLVRPAMTSNLTDIVARVDSSFPNELRVVPSDTAASLAKRLGASDFLDEIHVLKGGNGKGGRVRLNQTMYAQPRRVTLSVLPEEAEDPSTLPLELDTTVRSLA